MKNIIMDIECFRNYFLVTFYDPESKKSIMEQVLGEENKLTPEQKANIARLLNKYLIITFNGDAYDRVILDAALDGYTCSRLKDVNDFLITKKQSQWQARRHYDINERNYNHIDVARVAPLKAGLKLYAARLHAVNIIDLPLDPDALVEETQIDELRYYCENDCDLTAQVADALKREILLRVRLSRDYKIDVRSLSDAQVGERIVTKLANLQKGYKVDMVKYDPPAPLKLLVGSLSGEQMKESIIGGLVMEIAAIEFPVIKGTMKAPPKLKEQLITIGQREYQMGIGGLHSTEKSQASHTDNNVSIEDWDVASYYPNLILNEGFAPRDTHDTFLPAYRQIVERRLAAKAAGDHEVNESLKIAINGSFGKLGSQWSPLYDPKMMLQVTLTGQLYLIWLIEMLVDNEFSVVSANTDGIMVAVPHTRQDEAKAIREKWMAATRLLLEVTQLKGVYARDVNNYFAIKHNGEIKGKGVFGTGITPLWKNPMYEVVTKAVIALAQNNLPIEDYIRASAKVTVEPFLLVRTVRGGAETKEGEYVGSTCRWVKTTADTLLRYIKSGNKVPLSDGAYPMQDLSALPDNLDLDWYIKKAKDLAENCGMIV